jgi:hypothetical protein
MAAQRMRPLSRTAEHMARLFCQSAHRTAWRYVSASRHLVGKTTHRAPGNRRNGL